MKSLREHAIDLGLVLGSTVITLAIMELALRAFFPQPTDYFYYTRVWEPGRTYRRWGVDVRINSHGQRDDERSLGKPKGTYRIAILGDSIAYGSGVRVEDTYAKRLEAALNRDLAAAATSSSSEGGRTTPSRVEVLTFTNGGNEPRGYLEMMRTEARRFAPDLVMVGFTLNDFERREVQRTWKQSWYDLVTDIHQRLRIWSHLYFFVFERSRSWLYEKRFLDRAVRNRYELGILEATGAEFEDAWLFTQGNLLQIGEESASVGARYGMLVFPYEMQLTPNLRALYHRTYGFESSPSILEALPQARLREFCGSHSIPLVDMFTAFKNAAEGGEGLYFREFGRSLDWVHPNVRGHELASSVLYDALRCRDELAPELASRLPRSGCPGFAADALGESREAQPN